VNDRLKPGFIILCRARFDITANGILTAHGQTESAQAASLVFDEMMELQQMCQRFFFVKAGTLLLCRQGQDWFMVP